MEPQVLEANVTLLSGIPVIDLRGEINGFAQQVLDAAYVEAEAQARGAAAILLNFEGVTYINSTGIALIVNLLGRAMKNGSSLVACALSQHYQQIFDLTRLAQYIRVFPNTAAALDEMNLQKQQGA